MKSTYFWGFIRGFLVWPSFLLLGILTFFGVAPNPEILKNSHYKYFPQIEKKNPCSYMKQTDHVFILAFFNPSFVTLLASFLTFFWAFFGLLPSPETLWVEIHKTNTFPKQKIHIHIWNKLIFFSFIYSRLQVLAFFWPSSWWEFRLQNQSLNYPTMRLTLAINIWYPLK